MPPHELTAPVDGPTLVSICVAHIGLSEVLKERKDEAGWEAEERGSRRR